MDIRFRLKGDYASGQVWLNDELIDLDESLKVRSHSPTGFSWGYAGSGCAQLALAVCLKLLGVKEKALQNYQKFKMDVISKQIFGDDFEINITYNFID